MAIEVADQAEAREHWIHERMLEFSTNPEMRDRAIAIILYDSMMLHEQFETMTAMVKKEGLGGMIKAMMGAMR